MTWPVCPHCGLSGSVMNDFVSQRFDVGKRVQWIRSWSRLAEELQLEDSTVRETFFYARRALQNLVCGAPRR